MKRSEKQLPIKANYKCFLELNCSICSLNQSEHFTDTKNVKAIKFEDVWGELQTKKSFQRQ